mgnify:CR=1 FL=1
MISLNSVPEIKKDIAWRIIDGKAIVIRLNENKKEVLNIFNDTATRIWELIEEGNSMKKILLRLSGEYNINAQNIEKDLREAISEMVNQKMITVLS